MKLRRTLTVHLEADSHEVLAAAVRDFGRTLVENDIDSFDGIQVARSKDRVPFWWEAAWVTVKVSE